MTLHIRILVVVWSTRPEIHDLNLLVATVNRAQTSHRIIMPLSLLTHRGIMLLLAALSKHSLADLLPRVASAAVTVLGTRTTSFEDVHLLRVLQKQLRKRTNSLVTLMVALVLCHTCGMSWQYEGVTGGFKVSAEVTIILLPRYRFRRIGLHDLGHFVSI